MKTIQYYLAFVLILLIVPTPSIAQQGVVSAGGDISGPGGTMSFSTGQTDFQFFSSETGSMQFGLQQAFFFEEDPGPDIPQTRQLTSGDIFQGEDQCFDATQTIILAGGGTTFIVEDETGVELIAGYSILMLPGTMVEHGGYMHAQITSSEGPFCEPAEPIVASLQVDPPDGTTYQEPLITPGIEKTDIAFFRVFPNPTAGDFTVEMIDRDLMDQTISIEIIGMRGELVNRINETGQLRHHLSLQWHQPGLYMIRVQCGDVFGIARIIKK